MNDNLDILLVNTSDRGGGAERIAMDLLRGYQRQGCNARLAVGRKHTGDPNVVEIAHPQGDWQRGWTQAHAWAQRQTWRGAWRLAGMAAAMADTPGWLTRRMGRENMHFPGTWDLLGPATAPAPALIHAHNLHGGYFDLRALPWLSSVAPLMLTLHDAWLLAGHCAHSLDCLRWRQGCGACPRLKLPYPLVRDATAANWQLKRDIFTRSRLYLATPSHWLMEKARRSLLAPAIAQSRVIPNGVDLSIFHPGDRSAARQALNLPADARVVLFVANKLRRSAWKDYDTLQAAMETLGATNQGSPLILLALGEDAPPRELGSAQIRFVPFCVDPAQVARHYQAADVYVHAAKADTFPTAILEAMACGLPVVASAVGGIPEQVSQGQTGFLVAPGDGQALAQSLAGLLGNKPLRQSMGAAAAAKAVECFSLEQQVRCYLQWQQSIIATRIEQRRRAA